MTGNGRRAIYEGKKISLEEGVKVVIGKELVMGKGGMGYKQRLNICV